MNITPEVLQQFHLTNNHGKETRQLYAGVFRRWAEFGLGELTQQNAELFRQKRIDQGRSINTVVYEVRKINKLAKHLKLDVYCKPPQPVQREPIAWSRKQLRTLFSQARNSQRSVYSIPGNIFWPAILGVCYDTAERIGAVSHLEWSDVDLERRTILFRAETRKGRRNDLLRPIGRQTRRDLEKLRDVVGHQKWLFNHGSPTTLWTAYKQLLVDAHLPHDRNCKYHRLRRTHATEVHVAGGDATAALGHGNPRVTWSSYIDKSRVRSLLPWRPVLDWFRWGRL